MPDKQQSGIITLIRSALDGRKYDLPDGFSLEETIPDCASHKLHAILFYGASNCGYALTDSTMQRLFESVCQQLTISARQLNLLQQVYAAFEQNGIDYAPLKGAVLKSLYPRADMRFMGDADILIRVAQYDAIRPVMESLGFAEQYESDHELIWTHPALRMELHKRIVPSYNKDFSDYFGDGWQRMHKADGSAARWQMSPEDTFNYLFTHFATHYRDCGIGINHLVDLQVYLQANPNLDFDYITGELKKLHLDAFYENIRAALAVWFDGKETDEKSEFITQVIFHSGIYGKWNTHLFSDAVKKSKGSNTNAARNKKVLQMIFLPYENMCQRYSVLKKVPVLLPVMWVVRWGNAALFRHQNIADRNNDRKLLSTENIEKYQQELNFVGLDYNFKE